MPGSIQNNAKQWRNVGPDQEKRVASCFPDAGKQVAQFWS